MIIVHYRIGIYMAMFALLAGCAFNHSLAPDEVDDKNSEYPTINLVVAPKSEWITQRYLQYINEIKVEFENRNRFPIASPAVFSPYTIEVIHDITDKRSHPQMIWWTLTAFSLFIIPSQYEMEHKMDINIYKNNKLIKQYSYTDLVTGWTMLFSPGGFSAGEPHVNIFDQFFYDLDRDGIFQINNSEKNGITI